MKFFLATVHSIWGWLLRLGITLFLLLALLVFLSRVLLPHVVDDFRPDIAQSIGQFLHMPVHIQDLALTWQGWIPTLHINDFRLQDPVDESTLTRFEEVVVSLDIGRSLLAGRLVLSHVRLAGSLLTLEQGTDQRLRVIPQSAGRPPLALQRLADWLLSMESLDLTFATLKIYELANGQPPQNFGPLRLSLRRDDHKRHLNLELTPPFMPDRYLKAALELQASAGAWQANGYFTLIDAMGKPGLSSTLDLALEPTSSGSRLQGRLRDLRLQDLTVVASPLLQKHQRTLLAALSPQGQVSELVLRTTLEEGDSMTESIGDYALSMHFQGLESQAWKHIPGISGLAGSLALDRDSGQLNLDARTVRVDVASLLRAPVTFDTVTGLVHWRREGTGWQLESPGLTLSNAALNAHLQGSLTLFDDATSPLLDLSLDYRDVAVEQAHDYLPARIMHPKLTAWLDQALVSGRIPQGTLTFHGHVADFPFDQGEGLFETRFATENTVLDYFPGWPRFEQLAAEVVFRNRAMQIEATAGKLFGTELDRVQAQMDDLKNGALLINGQIQAPGTTLLRFVRESPLAPKLGRYLADLDATGDNTLNLNLIIPFHHKPIKVAGELGFQGGRVRLAPWNIDLERIEGTLGFTGKKLSAENMQLLFKGEPASLDIETHDRKAQAPELRFRLNARLSVETLLGKQAPALLEAAGDTPLISGESPWEILLVVPGTTEIAAAPALTLSSPLKGTEVNLPPPFGKPAGEARDFKLQVNLAKTGPLELKLDYAPDIQAALELADFPAKPRITRGELRIGTGDAKLPDTPGLTVKAHLSRFKLPAAITGARNGMNGFAWLNTLDAHIDELIIGSQRFLEVSLQAEQRDEALTVMIDGKEIAGRFFVPAAPNEAVPVTIALRRLALGGKSKTRETSARSPDPRALPPFSVMVEDFSLAGKHLGRLSLSAIPKGDGVRFTNIELAAGHARFSAQGDWLVVDGRQMSSIQAKLHSDDLGKSVKKLGYKFELEGGETNAELAASWAAPFPDFSPELLDGRLELDIDEGRLVEIDPGMGRVTGLLNPSTVSRRLMLDFSDFLENGLAFDEIKGHISFKNGQAYTDDLHLEAPSARVDIDGRFDLKAYQYDQLITVTPRISASLPIAGAIAGGPVVGMVMLLAERIFHQEIDKVSRYQYRLTGSWNKPSLKPISKPITASEPAVDETR